MRARGGALVLILRAALAPSAYAQPAPTCDGSTATIVGTEGPNFLNGDYRQDVVKGRGGDDVLRGGSTEGDEVFGGPGYDRCHDAADRLVGCERTP